MSTKENLKDAFAGESQANRKYLAYAKKADQEKLPGIAKHFRAAAHAETVHALNHLRAMGGIADTVTNLKDAACGEDFEFTKMYPPYVEQAKQEGDKAAERGLKPKPWVKTSVAPGSKVGLGQSEPIIGAGKKGEPLQCRLILPFGQEKTVRVVRAPSYSAP